MIKLTFISLLSILFFGCSESGDEKKGIQYYEYSSKELAFPDSTAYFKKNMTPFSGIAVDSSENGGYIISRKQYLNGHKHGPHKYYCCNNLLVEEINYKNGLRHGESKMWDTDGQLRARKTFSTGILKESFFWDANGKKTNEYDPLDYIEIKDFVPVTNTQSSSSSTINPDPKPKPPTPSPKNNNNSNEELIDSKTDDNSVSNPFGGSNGGNGFSSAGNSNGNASDGSSMGNGEGKGFGDPTRLNKPIPPDYDTDYSGNVCVELLINDKGKAISAKSCNSTSHPDQNVVKSVVEYVKKNIKYKAEPGAPNRKALFTVYIPAS